MEMQTAGMTRIYTVAAFRMARVERTVSRFIARAEKLNLTPHLTPLALRELSRELRAVGDTEPCEWRPQLEFVTFELTGFEPVIAGWQLMGVMEICETGNIFRTLPGAEIPETFRFDYQRCDHCQTRRYRKQTFILRNATGEYKQVGGDCLSAFLGGHDPHAFCAWLELLNDCAASGGNPDDDEIGGCYGRHECAWRTQEIVRAAAMCAVQFGYLSNSRARELAESGTFVMSTAQRVMDNIHWAGHRLSESERIRWNDAAIADVAIPEADAALAWILQTEHATANSDYLRNLHYVALSGTVRQKDVPILVSVIGTYRRFLERETERAKARESEPARAFIGTLGKREKFTLTLTTVFDFDGAYGVTHLHKFEDAAGNLAIWWSSAARLTEGQTYTGKCTVKEHKQNPKTGRPETVLTRCAF
jgi:hypothetical protein